MNIKTLKCYFLKHFKIYFDFWHTLFNIFHKWYTKFALKWRWMSIFLLLLKRIQFERKIGEIRDLCAGVRLFLAYRNNTRITWSSWSGRGDRAPVRRPALRAATSLVRLFRTTYCFWCKVSIFFSRLHAV